MFNLQDKLKIENCSMLLFRLQTLELQQANHKFMQDFLKCCHGTSKVL